MRPNMMTSHRRTIGVRVLRTIVFLAAVTGILGLLGSAAQAYMPQQHCEPLWPI